MVKIAATRSVFATKNSAPPQFNQTVLERIYGLTISYLA